MDGKVSGGHRVHVPDFVIDAGRCPHEVNDVAEDHAGNHCSRSHPSSNPLLVLKDRLEIALILNIHLGIVRVATTVLLGHVDVLGQIELALVLSFARGIELSRHSINVEEVLCASFDRLVQIMIAAEIIIVLFFVLVQGDQSCVEDL